MIGINVVESAFLAILSVYRDQVWKRNRKGVEGSVQSTSSSTRTQMSIYASAELPDNLQAVSDRAENGADP